jgi:hypothetical protein
MSWSKLLSASNIQRKTIPRLISTKRAQGYSLGQPGSTQQIVTARVGAQYIETGINLAPHRPWAAESHPIF